MGTDRLVVHDGQVFDDAVGGPVPIDEHDPVCNDCQRPGADVRAFDGEWYHAECRPDTMRP